MTRRDSFASLFDDAPSGYLVTTVEGEVLRANRMAGRLVGQEPEGLVGRTVRDLLTPGSRLFYETRHQPVLRLGGAVHEVALELTHADGAGVPVLVTSAVDPDDPALVRTILFSSAQRHDYERDLLRARRAAETSESRLRVLQEAIEAMTSSDGETTFAEALCAHASEAMDSSSTAVFLGERPDELDAAHCSTTGEEAEGVLRSIAQRAVASGAPVIAPDLEALEQLEPGLADRARRRRVQAAVAVPLRDGEQVLGAIVCAFGRPRTLDPDQLELLRTIVLQATPVLVRQRLAAALEWMATHDSLTGLVNRDLLTSIVQDAAGRASATRKLSILFFDLDGFKSVNDRFGHAAGDLVLRTIGERVSGVVRESDTVARFGGDEFAVVCEGADLAEALRIADRVRASVARQIDGVGVSIAASIGLVVVPAASRDASTASRLFAAADDAMYRAKAEGGDRVVVADSVEV